MQSIRFIQSAVQSVSQKYLSIIITVIIAVLFADFLSVFFQSREIMADAPVIVTIERGMGTHQIADLLKSRAVINNPRRFRIGARLLGLSSKLQAGKYIFSGKQSNYSVLKKLAQGRVVMDQITFPEGMRSREMAGLAQKQLHVDSTVFIQLVHNPEFCKSLNIPSTSLEGYLFPETYRFHTDVTEQEVLSRMVRQYRTIFTDSLRKIANTEGFNEHEIITIASLVEGEALVDSERPIIAAIYMNRLGLGRLLESCPTVQYIIDGPPRRLLLQDLDIESPYNTYIHAGLPPGPVNNPGLASILAVLNPADVDYLYLVANGDGTHTFSRNLEEHNRAKQRFERIRRLYR